MRFFTPLLVPASVLFLTTVTVKAQVNPNVWADSVATRRVLADTSVVSPFMPVGTTKHEEKIAAIKAYCDCESILFAERRDRFEVLRENWPKLSRNHNIYEVKYYILGIFKLRGENLATPVRFEFSPLVRPLVHAEQLAEMAKEKQLLSPTSEIKSGIFICREQARLMYPACALPNLWDVYSQAKAETARQSDLYDAYKHSKIEPWLDSLYKQPSAVAQLNEHKPLSEAKAELGVHTTKIATTKPAPALVKSSAIPRSGYKYPVFISTMDPIKRETVSQDQNIGGYSGYIYSKTKSNTYKSWYGYIDSNGKAIKIDSTSATYGLPYGSQLYDIVKYRNQAERDSFQITASDKFNTRYRVVMEPTGPPTVLYILNRYQSVRAPLGWGLTDKTGEVIMSCKDFKCGENNRLEKNSRIQYLGNNRYWVIYECSERPFPISFLYDGRGRKLAEFAPKRSYTVDNRAGAIALASAVTPDMFGHYGRYVGGYLALSNNIVINLDGQIVFKTDKYDIKQLIDNKVLVAYSKLPSGYYTYSYINYRTGKVIYTDLDYERRGFSMKIVN